MENHSLDQFSLTLPEKFPALWPLLSIWNLDNCWSTILDEWNHWDSISILSTTDALYYICISKKHVAQSQSHGNPKDFTVIIVSSTVTLLWIRNNGTNKLFATDIFSLTDKNLYHKSFFLFSTRRVIPLISIIYETKMLLWHIVSIPTPSKFSGKNYF